MIDKNKIFDYLDKNFERFILQNEKEKEKHIKNVTKAIEWFNDNLIDKTKSSFEGSKVNVNGVVALCTTNNLRGAPFFNCYFIFMPYSMTDNLGSGCGNSHKIDFNKI